MVRSPPAPGSGPVGAATARRGRWLGRIVLTLTLTVLVLLGVGFYLVRTPPAHWRQYERFKATHTPRQIESLATALEARLHALVELDVPSPLRVGQGSGTRVAAVSGGADEPADLLADPSMIRVDEVRTLTLTQQELTALVSARHEQWLTSRGYVKPSELSDVTVNLKADGLVASFKYSGRQFSQVFSAQFKLNFDTDGTATIRLDSFNAGRLPLPTGGVGDYLQKHGEAESRAGEWLAKLDNFQFKPVLDDLPHRRRARVLGYQIGSAGIELTIRVQDFRTYQETGQTPAANVAMVSGE